MRGSELKQPGHVNPPDVGDPVGVIHKTSALFGACSGLGARNKTDKEPVFDLERAALGLELAYGASLSWARQVVLLICSILS